jgi:hypothetical protein
MYFTEFFKTKVQKTDIRCAVRPKGIYKPKDRRNLKEWDGVKIFDIQDREFTKTAKKR